MWNCTPLQTTYKNFPITPRFLHATQLRIKTKWNISWMFFKVVHSYSQLIADCLHWFLGKASIKVSYQDIMASSKIASACDESAKSGKPVEITWSEEELPINQ